MKNDLKRTVKDLCVAVDRFVDGEGKQKYRYKKIGVEICEKKSIDNVNEERSYILLDRDVNLAGFPNLSDKAISTNVLVHKFEQMEKDNIENQEISECEEGIF